MKAESTSLRVLVAGGAGYIGSVVTAALVEGGHRVTVLDNLSKGHRGAVHPDARFVEGDIADARALGLLLRDGFDAAMHFAAFIEVGESVIDPAKYYRNNIAGSLAFFDSLREGGVGRLVFSSTAAVYGEPAELPISEDAPLLPVSPYGWSKLMVEQALGDYDRAYGFRSVALRYFNAGGAVGTFGENHRPESHLIPRILDAVMRSEPITVFGDDYDTRDGSCIRDYVHVRDIASAHVLACRYLADGGASGCFNLGTGTGYSVIEVIRCVERVTGRSVPFEIAPRREGDSAVLVASPEKARTVLGWDQELAGLDDIVQSAWNWKQRFPNGYGEKEG